MSDYTPISCGQHSEYELMAMHRKSVKLELLESEHSLTGRVADIVTRNGAEFMLLLLDDGQQNEIRLDLIRSVTPL